MDIPTAQYWFDKTTILTRQLKFKELKQEVIDQTNFLPDVTSLPQRLWHIINQTSQVPGCKTCKSKVSWDRRLKQYKTYCGNPRCPNIDPDIIEAKQSKINYDEIIQKRKETCKKKYGHSNYLASDEGRRAVKQSFANQTTEQKEKRYNKVKQSRLNTIRTKYGVDNVSFLNYNSPIQTLKFLDSKDWLHEQYYTNKKTQTEIAHELNIAGGATVIGKYLRKHDIEVLNSSPVSIGEKQVRSFLEQNNIRHTTNTRTIISPYELDIFIPEYKIAIEYCGLYWHSEQNGKDKQYHKRKYELCKDQGIQLITLYEDEWIHRNDQVKQKLLSLLGKDNREKIYARNCTIEIISTESKQVFFEQNHIQGNGPSSINIGLIHKGELVAALGFYKNKDQHYLNRYATKKRVIGGFSKLLNFFKQNYSWETIVSFADLRWSTGNLYVTTGWDLDYILPPDYYYSPDGHNRFHKFNYRRKNLAKLLPSFDPNLSEKQNCDREGILRIWDCGKFRFTIKHKYYVA